MRLKAYTTTLGVNKTVNQIHALLAKTGLVDSIMNKYKKDGTVESVAFSIMVHGRLLSFQLPAKVDKVYLAIQNIKEIPNHKKTKEQAARIAWRVIYYWIEAQLSMITIDCAEIAEVFLPYNIMHDGKTAYEAIINNTKLIEG